MKNIDDLLYKEKDTEDEKSSSIGDAIFNFLIFVIICAIIGCIAFHEVDPYGYNKYYELIVHRNNIEKTSIVNNKYYRDYDFNYVQNTDNFYPTNKDELLNVFYTYLNSGVGDFTFYCSKEYKSCTKDAEDLVYSDTNNVIGLIYEFVHPFNDYQSISCDTDSVTGRVHYHLTKEYTDEQIAEIEEVVDDLYSKLVDPNDTDYNNIKRVHDYLANNVSYDDLRVAYNHGESSEPSPYESDNAYGALIQKKAICGGYTSALSLFLEKMGLKNMRITSDTHIWNAVLLDGTWYHIDNTWDDGMYTNGKSFLQHKYFLIDTNTLLINDMASHYFKQSVYSELAQ